MQQPDYTNKEWMYQKYVIEQLSTYKIAKLLGTTNETIRRWLLRLGIPLRNYIESWVIRKENGEIVSEEGRRKRRERMKGNRLNPRGRLGKTYSYKHSSILRENREKVLKDSNQVCAKCGGVADVVHHKDLSTDNHDPSNLMPLCFSCHFKLHNALCRDRFDQSFLL